MRDDVASPGRWGRDAMREVLALIGEEWERGRGGGGRWEVVRWAEGRGEEGTGKR